MRALRVPPGKILCPPPPRRRIKSQAGGDLNAPNDTFRALVLEHQSMVFSIALRILGDPLLAEETAQDVFLQARAPLNGLQPADSMLPWLRRLTIRCAIDQARRHEQRPDASMDQDDLPELGVEAAPSDPLPSDQLRLLVGSLPVMPRTVIVLRYQEDMSAEEIAEALNMPVATVTSHLRRALRLLHEKAAHALR